MKNIICVLFLSIIFYACRKEKKGITLLPATSQSFSVDKIDADFTMFQSYIILNDSLQLLGNSHSIRFFQHSTPTNYDSLSIPLELNSVGNVFLNGVQFKEMDNNVQYYDTTQSQFSRPYHWQIHGNSNQPTVTFNHFPDFPVYLTPNYLPDTIRLSQNDTIEIGNYTGAYVNIYLRDMGYSVLTKTITYPTSKVILWANELTNNGFIGGQLQITLVIRNFSYKIIQGKTYKFNTMTLVNKVIETTL
jgi:hypothetical protein